ncbi:MAG: alpha/beta hydrolase [bacterium]
MHYREAGQGPLLLILPGNTSSSAMHAREIEYFSQRYRVICPDYLGTGKSSRLSDWPLDWWQRNVEDVAALLEYLGSGPAMMIGSSGGALVALTLAIDHAEMIRCVIAESCVTRYPADRLGEMMQHRKEPSPELVGFWLMAHGADWREVVRADTDMMLRLAEQGDVDYFEGRLKQIRCPVLLAGSLRDTTVPQIGTQLPEMAAQIPGAELLLVNEGEHPLLWTVPEVFYATADSFLVRKRLY